MKHINTSTFDFPTLIRNGFVYVDKTRPLPSVADAEVVGEERHATGRPVRTTDEIKREPAR